MDSNFVEVFPDPLVLTYSNQSNHLESKINLRNLTNEYIIFKIYNNQRLLYSAKPSTSFISPMQSTNITIKRFIKKEEISSKIQQGNDKFLLIFYMIKKVINSNEEAKEAFKSKLYMEDSKQETIISIIIKEENEDNDIETSYNYNENDLNNIGDDYNKGIKIYNDINENLRKESNRINQKIKDKEKFFEIIKTQKKLKSDKDQAMKQNTGKKNLTGDNFANILLVLVFLFGLLFGANLANGYNKLFKKKQIKKLDVIITNKNNSYINNTINGTNQNITIDDKNNTNIKNNTNMESNKQKNETIKIINNTNIDNNKNNKEKNENNKTDIDSSQNIIKNETDKKSNEKKEVIKKDNEINEKKKQSKDFLNFSFCLGFYICLIQILF